MLFLIKLNNKKIHIVAILSSSSINSPFEFEMTYTRQEFTYSLNFH